MVGYVPDEMKKKISSWVQELLFWRRDWVDGAMRNIDSVLDMTEEEFAERKKKYDEESEHFVWGLHRSLRDCINTALHSTNRSYADWTSLYNKREQEYANLYSTYAELIPQFPHEDAGRMIFAKPKAL